MNLIQLEAGAAIRTIALDSLPVVLGRQPPRGIAIVHATISREHARVFNREGGLAVADLNSSNGTFVNGEKVSRADLKHGDVLRLGQVELRVDLGLGEVASPASKDVGGAKPSAAELFGDDDGGIRLEEDHLRIDVHSGVDRPSGATSTFIAPPKSLGGGLAPPPPKSVYADALRRPEDPRRTGNLLTADVAQQSTFRRFVTIVVALAIAGGLFYGAMTMMESVTPDSGFDDEPAPTPEEDGG